MRKIFEFALEHATVTTDDIIRAVEMLDDECTSERLIEAMLGVDTKREDLADNVIDYNGNECTIHDFNFLRNEVEYEKVDKDTCYFKTQEEADNYTQTGNYKDPRWLYSDEYNISATWTHVGTHWCTINQWFKWMKNM